MLRFRGGPTLPAIFLGAAAGILASHLPGFALTPAVGVGIGAATAAVLRLPLSAVALATLLTVDAGTGDEPLIIVGVVVAYLTTVALSTRAAAGRDGGVTALFNLGAGTLERIDSGLQGCMHAWGAAVDVAALITDDCDPDHLTLPSRATPATEATSWRTTVGYDRTNLV